MEIWFFKTMATSNAKVAHLYVFYSIHKVVNIVPFEKKIEQKLYASCMRCIFTRFTFGFWRLPTFWIIFCSWCDKYMPKCGLSFVGAHLRSPQPFLCAPETFAVFHHDKRIFENYYSKLGSSKIEFKPPIGWCLANIVLPNSKSFW